MGIGSPRAFNATAVVIVPSLEKTVSVTRFSPEKNMAANQEPARANPHNAITKQFVFRNRMPESMITSEERADSTDLNRPRSEDSSPDSSRGCGQVVANFPRTLTITPPLAFRNFPPWPNRGPGNTRDDHATIAHSHSIPSKNVVETL